MTHPTESQKHFLAVFIAAAVFAIIVIRAGVQAFTIDEADTYLAWVSGSAASHWYPASNNHVLNSILMRFCATVFGPSEFSLRIPALIGAALYLGACYRLCMLLTTQLVLRTGLFVCLTVNPFILDYLVAARGYSLALGFLMCAIAVAAEAGLRDQIRIRLTPKRVCGLTSVLLALSFAANFSFAFVDAVVSLAIFGWVYRAIEPAKRSGLRSKAVLAAWCVIPGIVVSLFLSASAVLDWPKGQLWFGAKSLSEMRSGLLRPSVYRVNPHLVNPLLFSLIDGLKGFVVPGTLIAFGLHALATSVGFRSLDRAGRRRIVIGAITLGVVAATVFVHWVAFRLFGLLLPHDRTGLYFVSLITLAVGTAAAWGTPSRLSLVTGRILTATICVLAVYFIFCLRLTYFKEWCWNADNKRVYAVVSGLARKHQTRHIESHWKWVASLNYYRSAAGEDAFDEVVSDGKYDNDKTLYVLDFPYDEQYILDQKLKVVYHGQESGVAVAVRTDDQNPAAEAGPSVPVTADVRNLNRPGASDFYVGERFEVIVNGPGGEPVRLVAQRDSNDPSAAAYGKTDARGCFSLRGQMAGQHVGEWGEVWSVGSFKAPTVRFRVRTPPPGGQH